MRPTKYLALVAAGLLCSALFTASCSDDPEITVPPVAPGEPFMTDGEALFACDFQNKEVAEQSFTQYNTGNLTPYDPYAIGFTKEKPCGASVYHNAYALSMGFSPGRYPEKSADS